MSLPEARKHSQWPRRPNPNLACIVTLVALVGSGCASAGGAAAHHESCALRAADSTFAAGSPVYRDCAVDKKAEPINPSSRIDFRAPQVGNYCYSADVEFVVDQAGIPEPNTVRIVHANEQVFGQAVLDAVSSWRYRPAIKDGRPVRQIVEERRAVQTAVVVVRAGSGPPAGPPPRTAAPRC
jgi:hypothetical protein